MTANQPSSHLESVNCSANILIFALSVYLPTLMTGQTVTRSRGQPRPAARTVINLRLFPDFPASRGFALPRSLPRHSYKLPTRFHYKSNNGHAKCIYYCLNTLRTPLSWPMSVLMHSSFSDHFRLPNTSTRRTLVSSLGRYRKFVTYAFLCFVRNLRILWAFHVDAFL